MTVIVSPSANAAFYVAEMLITFLFVVPQHLSTVLFAVAAADPQVIARKLRFALRLSYSIGLPAVAVVCLCAHWVLSLYGRGYALIATLPMILLTLTYLPYVPRALYLAVCRATGKITRAAVVLSAFSSADSRCGTGAKAGGLTGVVAPSRGLCDAALVIVRSHPVRHRRRGATQGKRPAPRPPERGAIPRDCGFGISLVRPAPDAPAEQGADASCGTGAAA